MNDYKLQDRVMTFSKKIIIFIREIKRDVVLIPIIEQLVRSSTSIGANYMEANNASSRKDFRNKIFISKKEAQETLYWLEILQTYFKEKNEILDSLVDECSQLTRIFQKITQTIDGR